MHQTPNVLWLSVSPYLKCFDQRLLSQLIKHSTVHRWQYCQTIDEPCSAEAVVAALYEYLQSRLSIPLLKTKPATKPLPLSKAERHLKPHHSKVHLVGHGVSGIVGLLYARQYPQHVASLTLLSVNAAPAVNWQAHYYALRKLLPCSREIILGQMTRLLFGQQAPRFTTALAQLLAKDLDSNLTFHSLGHQSHIPAGGVEVPLLVCNGEQDNVTDAQQQGGWRTLMKPGDRLWHCPRGQHFCHFYQHRAVAKTILDYWAQLTPPASELHRIQSSTPEIEAIAPSDQYCSISSKSVI